MFCGSEGRRYEGIPYHVYYGGVEVICTQKSRNGSMDKALVIWGTLGQCTKPYTRPHHPTKISTNRLKTWNLQMTTTCTISSSPPDPMYLSTPRNLLAYGYCCPISPRLIPAFGPRIHWPWTPIHHCTSGGLFIRYSMYYIPGTKVDNKMIAWPCCEKIIMRSQILFRVNLVPIFLVPCAYS